MGSKSPKSWDGKADGSKKGKKSKMGVEKNLEKGRVWEGKKKWRRKEGRGGGRIKLGRERGG